MIKEKQTGKEVVQHRQHWRYARTESLKDFTLHRAGQASRTIKEEGRTEEMKK
jgi:hypothetical protein